jgi:predicted metal-dependent phosphotriesterase family hydrolase
MSYIQTVTGRIPAADLGFTLSSARSAPTGDASTRSRSVGLAMQLEACGSAGYSYVQETFLPRLRERGVSDAVLTAITVDDPRRVLELSEGGA